MISLFRVPLQGVSSVRPPARNKMEKQEANNQMGIQTVSLFSDFLPQSKVVSWWQRGRQVRLPSSLKHFAAPSKRSQQVSRPHEIQNLSNKLWVFTQVGRVVKISNGRHPNQIPGGGVPVGYLKPLNCYISTEWTSISTRSSHQISQLLLRLKLSNSFCLDQSSNR